MAEFLTNTFCMCGAYFVIAILWAAAEIILYGEQKPNKRDSVICFIVSCSVMIALAVFRQGV